LLTFFIGLSPVNQLEREFKRLKEEEGYRVLRSGWPDFLLIRPDRQTIGVELKDIGDSVKAEQFVMHDALRMAGLPVIVLDVEKVLRERARVERQRLLQSSR
jgi:hypothetical protein